VDIIWQRQVQGYLNGVEMAFYHGGADYTKPFVADIDDDGDDDLFVGEHDGYLNFFENLGGNPPAWRCVSTAVDSIDVGKHCAPALWDIDLDGDLDLFLGNEDGRIWYYRNDGTAQAPLWTFVTDFYSGIDVGYHALPFFADLDADNDDDLLIAKNSGGAVHLKNTGVPGNPRWQFQSSVYQGFNPGMKSSVCVVDLNGDNLNDLIMSSLEGLIYYFRNIGPPNNPNYQPMGVIAQAIHNGTPTPMDYDRDGDWDLISGECDGNLDLWINTGTPNHPILTYTQNQLAYLDLGLETKPALADLDADGDLDMIVGRYRWGMCWIQNVGSADSAAWFLADTAYINGFNPGGIESPALCDLNNDGDYDLVIGLENGTLAYIPNNGSPSVPVWGQPVYNYANIDVGTSAAPAFADIDGDGDQDMFIGSFLGTIRYLRNNGNASNPVWQDLGNLPGIDVGYKSAPAFVDLDDDGDFDMIIGNGNIEGWLTVYINEGSPFLYSWATPLFQYGNWDFGDDAAPCFGDLDDDGRPDLLIGCESGGFYLMKNLGPLHDVEITLTPLSTPVIIPPQGGYFDYNITVSIGDSAFTGSLWCDVTMPDGSIFGPTLGPFTLNLPPGFTGTRLRNQGVLGISPPGIYHMNGYLGLYPDSVWSASSFEFEKVMTGNGPRVDAWSNTGASFNEWIGAAPVAQEKPTETPLLASCHPNPFNPATTIAYQLQAADHVRLEIFDIGGRRIATLVDAWQSAGPHSLTFDGADLPSGIYVYRLQIGPQSISRKMMLMK
jgi:hypothetical protein